MTPRRETAPSGSATAPTRMEPKRVPSDECTVAVDGQTYHPHRDQWVELYAIQAVGEQLAASAMAQHGAAINAATTDEDRTAAAAAADASFDELCSYLADRIVAWTWTDLRGRPLPDPGSPATYRRLQSDEITWLMRAGLSTKSA